jgi:4-amino-4-deoxy-L-arabinose transferase-like glycosyltransferase
MRTVLVFCALLPLYLLSYKGITAGDDLYHYAAVKRWVQCGRTDLPASLDPDKNRVHGFFVAKGRDGRLFLALPPGLALASVPLGLIGEAVEVATGNATGVPDVLSFVSADPSAHFRALRGQPSAFFVGLVSPLATAAMVALFFGLATALSRDKRSALATTALLGLSTAMWPYATTYWSQALATLCIVGTVAGLSHFEDTGRSVSLVAAGFFCAYGVLTRTELVLVAPCAFLYLVAVLRARRIRAVLPLTAFTAPLLCGAGLWLGWNLLRFGHPLETGSIHQAAPERWFQLGFMLQSVPAEIASLQRSVFIYSPPLLLALAGWRAMIRRRPHLCILCGGIVVVLFGFYSTFRMWNPVASWGPRFLVPLTPLLLLPLAGWVSGATWRRWAALALGLVGLLVQLAAVVPGYLTSEAARYWGDDPRVADLYRKTDLVPQLAALLAGRRDLWWLSGAWNLTAGLLLFGLTVLAAAALVRSLGQTSAGNARAGEPDLSDPDGSR